MTSIATPAAPVAERALPSVRTVGARAGRDLLYLTIGLATSVVAFAVWLTGVIVSAVLLPFVVGLPVALGVAAAVRWTATLDRRNAVVLDSRRIASPYGDHAAPALGGRLRATFGNPRRGGTWRG